MKNKELFDRTIAILVDCYFGKTLRHFNCYACAVGNLVAANCGIGYKKCSESMYGIIYDTINGDTYQPEESAWFKIIRKDKPTPLTHFEVDATGYSIDELILIEDAFESANPNQQAYVDADGFNGLMAVIDALIDIHEAPIEQAAEAKQLFLTPTI